MLLQANDEVQIRPPPGLYMLPLRQDMDYMRDDRDKTHVKKMPDTRERQKGVDAVNKPTYLQDWYLEAEEILYSYPAIDDQIDQLQAQIEELLPVSSSSIIQYDHNRGSKKTDPTAEYGMKRMMTGQQQGLVALRQQKKLIQKALRRMTEDEKTVIRLVYFERKNAIKTMKKMHIGKTNYYSIKNSAVTLAATHLGLYCLHDKLPQKCEQNANRMRTDSEQNANRILTEF